MGWSHVQDAPGSGGVTNGTSSSGVNIGAFGSANTLGDYIIVYIAAFSTNATFTVTDNAQTPNTYTQLFRTVNGSAMVAAFLAPITSLPSAGNLNVKVTPSATTAMTLCASEFSGGSSNTDGSAVLTGGSSASPFAGGPLTTIVANDLLISVFANQGATQTGVTPPSGMTAAGSTGSSTYIVGGGAYQILSGTVSSHAENWSSSQSSAVNYAIGVIAIQPAASPGGKQLLVGVGA